MADLSSSSASADRGERLRMLGERKTQLALGLTDVERVDRILRSRWDVDFFETPLELADHVDEVASDAAANRYRTAHAQAVSELSRGGNEHAIYEAMCDPELLGIVTSSRRAILIDSLSVAVALVRSLGLTGPVLDAGCHAGVASDVLAELLENEIWGIDPLGVAIEAARARVNPRVNLEVAAIPWHTQRRFEMVLALDSMPRSIADRASFLRGVSELLQPGGIAVITSAHWVSADVQVLRRQLAGCRLGYALADVVGGYSGAPTQFVTEGCVVLVRDGKTEFPRRVSAIMESDWHSFRDYANAPGTPKSRKTQAFQRAAQMSSA